LRVVVRNYHTFNKEREYVFFLLKKKKKTKIITFATNEWEGIDAPAQPFNFILLYIYEVLYRLVFTNNKKKIPLCF